MGTKQPPGARGQLSADEPSRRRGERIQAVPVGLERVLYAAAEDPAFRDALLDDTEQAIAARGFKLRESERAMLRAVPLERLLAASDGIDTAPAAVERRGFMRAVAAGAAAVAVANCDGAEDDGLPDSAVDSTPMAGFDATGSRPDMPGPDPDLTVDSTVPGYDSTGIRPDAQYDAPSDTVPVPDMPAVTGIRPDGS